jgi:hypothetical protein
MSADLRVGEALGGPADLPGNHGFFQMAVEGLEQEYEVEIQLRRC